MSALIRAFVAIDLPDPAVQAIARLQAALPVGRAVGPETLHLTLAFLGERPRDWIEAAHDGLDRIAAPGFALELAGLDTFGRGTPKILFAGVERNPALGHLRKRVGGALHAAGVELGRERFRPHVTLARFRPDMEFHDLDRLQRFLSDHAGFALAPFPVTSFALYRSTLRPQGPLHEELARYALT